MGVGVRGLNLRFKFGLCLNLNLLRGSGSGILPNLIPEPQVQNQVRTGFGRFGNWTMASLRLDEGERQEQHDYVSYYR